MRGGSIFSACWRPRGGRAFFSAAVSNVRLPPTLIENCGGKSIFVTKFTPGPPATVHIQLRDTLAAARFT